MLRKRWFGIGTVATSLLLMTPAPARSQDSALAQVPADAPIVLHVRGYERTKERLIGMIKKAVPDLAAGVQDRIEDILKEGLKDRQVKALPKDGSIFLVFTEFPKLNQGIPKMAVILAVTNYVDFRDAILTTDEKKNLKADKAGYEVANIENEDIYFIDRKTFAVVTPDKEVAAQFTKKYAGLDGKLAKPTAQKLLESDLAAYVDMTAFNKEFGDQIKAFRPLIKLFMAQGAAQLDKTQAEMIEAMFNGFFQFLDDSRGFLAAGEFRPEGLALHFQAQVGADTKINSFLKTSKPSSLDDLGKLPAGQMGYWAMKGGAEISKALGPYLMGMMGDSEGKDNKALQEALDLIADAGPDTMLGNYNLPVEGIFVFTYKDPAKAVEGSFKLFQAMSSGTSFGNMALKEKPTLTRDAQSHRGFKLHSVSLKWDFEKFAEKAPQGGKEIAEAMKSLMGEGSNQWFGTDGKVFITVTAKDWTAAKKHLDEFLDGKSTVGAEKSYLEARKNLPAQATMLVLIDMPMYIQAMSRIMGPLFKSQGLPIEIPILKATKGKSYFGMALALQPEIGNVDLWIPGTVAAEVKKMVEQVMGGQIIQ
jgi:hypothetical protein